MENTLLKEDVLRTLLDQWEAKLIFAPDRHSGEHGYFLTPSEGLRLIAAIRLQQKFIRWVLRLQYKQGIGAGLQFVQLLTKADIANEKVKQMILNGSNDF